MQRNFNQKSRLLFLLVYIAILLVANGLLFGHILPAGLWFWAAFLAILLSTYISQPFFTAPKDALSNSIAAISTVSALLATSEINDSQKAYWAATLLVLLLILVIAIFAMVFSNSIRPRLKVLAESLTRISGVFGSPKALFTAIFFLTLFTFHNQVVEVFWLSLVWLVVVLGQPLENLTVLYQRIKRLLGNMTRETQLLGGVAFRREPGLVTISVSGDGVPDVGKLIFIPMNASYCQLGVILDNYRLSNQQWSRALVFADRVPKSDIEAGWGTENTALHCKKEQIKECWLNNNLWQSKDWLIGSVIEESNASLVRIELYKDSLSFFEGQLLSININDQAVLYQIINGITKSELLRESNRHGFMSIEARKLGCWNSEAHRFDQVSWTPKIYSPVLLVSQIETPAFQQDCIGYVPQTDYGVKVNVNNLVTHNTAILGVLGSGKTSLAIELIHRMVNEGVKVWIIDITGQYEPTLDQLVHLQKQKNADEKIENSIIGSANKLEQNKELGGNHKDFAEALKQHIKEFLEDGSWRVRVFNPYNYTVTGQITGVFNNSAGFGNLTITQITKIVAEELLKCLKDEMTEEARLCLVFEEAHSLVPEWNSVAHDGDKQATSGTAKAILQGRKYGFGCLLITQRTANVTKSILNQCNTIFGLKVFDTTGMDFLSNYIGSDYAALLATLPDRHCVAFGRGLNMQTPLIIKLNDQEDFMNNFEIADKSYLGQGENTTYESHNILDDIPF